MPACSSRLPHRARADQEAERHRAHAGHALGDHAHAGGQRGDAVLGQRRSDRATVGPSRAGRPRAVAIAPAAGGVRRASRHARARGDRCRCARRRPPPPPVPTPASSSTLLPAISGSSARRRPMRPRSRSTSTTRTLISSPLLSTSSTLSTRCPGETLEMCSSPSVPLASSTKAPKVVVLTTLPSVLVADLDLLHHHPHALHAARRRACRWRSRSAPGRRR